MKNILLFIGYLFIIGTFYAQDLIVTNPQDNFLPISTQNKYTKDLIVTKQNDSIVAKITKNQNDDIYFIVQKNGKKQLRKINKSKIKNIQFDFAGKLPKTNYDIDSKSTKVDIERFRIAVNGGFNGLGNIFANSKKFVSNAELDINAHLFLITNSDFLGKLQQFGAGFKYVLSTHFNSDITVNFIGFSFLSKTPINNKHAFIIATSIGSAFISNTQNEESTNEKELAVIYDLGYEFKASKNIYIGIKTAYSTVLLNSATSSGRFSLSFGLRYSR